VRRLFYILPVVGFLVLALFLKAGLKTPPPAAMRSALLDKPAPATVLPALDPGQPRIVAPDFKSDGRVTIVNFFASWCVPCREEAPQLAQLARARGIRLIGIAYKDKPEAARAFLAETGNPFEKVMLDSDGRAGIDWGVTGVPETFLIDRHGVVRAHFGPLSQDGLMVDVLPEISHAAQR
jgi:DsbE subfamily thiol:disulfide oxidoreductase